MKQNLGKWIFFLFFPLIVCASNEYVSYSYNLSSTKPYIYESVAFRFDVEQLYEKEVMFFELEPLEGEGYTLELITQKRSESSYHNAAKHYEYLIIPQKTGSITVAFRFGIRLASDDAVAQTYVGSRDNVKYIPAKKVTIATLKIPLEVQPLPKEVMGVGEFALQEASSSKKLYAYDPFDVTYEVEGVGYLKENVAFLKNLPQGVDLFGGLIKEEKKATSKGYHYKQTYKYALVAAKSFTIPAQTFVFFNPKTKQLQKITLKPVDVVVTPKDVASLVDVTQAPKEESFVVAYVVDGIYYLLAFVLGVFARELFGRYIQNNPIWKKKIHQTSPIAKLKTPQALLNFLLAHPKKEMFFEEITLLELIVYKNKEVVPFSKIKKRVENILLHS